jgi:hypothetical protein
MIVTLRNRQTEYVIQAEFSDFKDEMYSFRDEVYARFDNMYTHMDTRFKEQRKEMYEYMDRRFKEQRKELNEDYERHTGMILEKSHDDTKIAMEHMKSLIESHIRESHT